MSIRAYRIVLFCLGLSLFLVLAAFASPTGPEALLPVVGVWQAGTDEGKEVLKVDGSAWKRGRVAAQFQQSAIRLWSDKSPEFMKSVVWAANFPFAVYEDAQDFQAGSLSVRFKPLAGTSDQAAGIIFNLKQNGDYLVLRANALENNVILFEYKNGHRTALKEIENTPPPTSIWNELQVIVSGRDVKGYLNGTLLLQHVLAQPVSGKVGLWSKDDSVVLFEGFTAREEGK